MPDPRPGDEGPAIHVVLRKEELDPDRLAGKVVVVVDVLFATTSIITALDAGAAAVYPAVDADEARRLSRRPALSDAVLAGEAMFRFIDGFVQPTPLALEAHIQRRANLIYTTTNGTVALRAAAGAERVLAGALINADATARALPAPDRAGGVIVVCAGTAGAFNLEDFYGAGALVDAITRRRAGYRLTDAAVAASHCFRSTGAGEALGRSYVGRLMHEWGLDAEVAFAARTDHSATAAELRGDRVIALHGEPTAA